MILSICETPEVLQITKYVKIAIDIIRIVVPIILIITIIVSLVNVVSGNSEELPKALKSSVNKILAAVLVFLVPTFINMIISLLGASNINYAACLDNATDEIITAAYVSRAQANVEKANTSLNRSDYSYAVSLVNSLKDEKEKAKLTKQLKTIEEKVADKEKEAVEKESLSTIISGTGLVGKGIVHPLGDKTATFSACFEGNDSVHNGSHGAVDLAIAGGTPVYAAKAGKVIATKNNVTCSGMGCCNDDSISCGNYVKIDHFDGSVTLYCHMQTGSLQVSTGQMVDQGKPLGLVGTTGCSTGNHLHFAIRINGVAVNPIKYVNFKVYNPGGC